MPIYVIAENQSMFLDSLCGDGAWRGRYAKDRSGAALPWDLHEAELRATHPYRVTHMPFAIVYNAVMLPNRSSILVF